MKKKESEEEERKRRMFIIKWRDILLKGPVLRARRNTVIAFVSPVENKKRHR